MEQDALVGAILIPVVVAAALLFAARSLRHRWEWCNSALLPGIALAGATVAAFIHQSDGLPLPPHISFDWFPWGVVVTATAACTISAWISASSTNLASSSAAAIAAAAAFTLVSPAGLDTPSRIGGAMVAATTSAIAAAALRSSGPSAATGMWGSAAALSGLVILSSFAKLAVILGAFSAAAAAIGVLALIQRPLVIGIPAVAVWCAVMATASMYAMGYHDGGIPRFTWWIAAASPAAAGLSLLPAVSRRPRLAACVRAGAPIAVAVAAVAAALFCGPTNAATDPEYDAYGAR